MALGTQQVFGIQELYRPAHEPAEIDIVAVHGLNGDAIKTWTSNTEGVCWLNHPDLLPKYIKHARVLTWGYNANISSLTGKATSSDRILQHAQTLVARLHAERDLEDANDRPIIFLCHSLGGIIVKRVRALAQYSKRSSNLSKDDTANALAYSASRIASKIAHLHSVYTCTFAILFFGTPHNGSSKARLLGSLQKLASLAIPKGAVQLESSLLNALEEESETLQNITDQFTPLMANFRIFFFWEQEKTDLKYTKDYIVDEASAAPILDNTERCGIAGDHRGMCKFGRGSSQGFRTTVAALRRYSHEAPQVIRGRWIKAADMLSEKRRHEAMEMLEGIQLSSDRAYIREIPERTDVSPYRKAVPEN